MRKTLSLLVSLTAISAVCAAILAFLNAKTEEPIRVTGERKALDAASAVMPSSVAKGKVEKVADGEFVGRDEKGAVAGYAIEGEGKKGYGGPVRLMVGFEADAKTVVSYKTLKASETPGLGMKLNEPGFRDQFSKRDGTALKVNKDGGEIIPITAATITSRAVCEAIADAQAKARSRAERLGK
ncbi:MAG: FMN-binding protein [Kiritimatiellae bacterium]|nr:FMN-binding protein [Kiritimatiellia bacterium]